MKLILWVGLVLSALSACTRAPQEAELRFHSDSGLTGGAYEQIVDRLKAFQLAHAELVSTETYGKSVGGRPLFLVKVAEPRDGRERRPVVVLTQAIHGNEYLGIVDKLPAEFLDHPADYPAVTRFLAGGGVFYFVPIANPDGYEAIAAPTITASIGSRLRRRALRDARAAGEGRGDSVYRLRDAHARSLRARAEVHGARDASARRSDERDVAEVNGKVKLTFDYHCCPEETIGSLMHSWGDTKELRDGTIPAADIPRFESVAAVFKQTFSDHLWGSGYQIVQYLTFGTTDEWFYENFVPHGALAFCYEGQARGEDKKLKSHARMWERMLSERALLQ